VRRNSGFTILEIIVVLLLLTILAATVLGRSALPEKLDLSSATEKLRLQLRYAQAQAMKRPDPYVYGIKSLDNVYWFFKDNIPDDSAKQLRIPGADYTASDNKVRANTIGVTISGFTVFFDRLGKPFTDYTNPTTNIPLAGTMTITISGSGDTRSITITPETGLVQ
jgi:prepilin-type N-terminal cleavage/methylation domain-containing protein